jgi:hypothetical protein
VVLRDERWQKFCSVTAQVKRLCNVRASRRNVSGVIEAPNTLDGCNQDNIAQLLLRSSGGQRTQTVSSNAAQQTLNC